MCKRRGIYNSKNAICLRIWLVALAMSAACGYPSLPTVCDGQNCQPGQECAANQDVCIDIGGCGDGVVDPEKGEVCDDGNVIGGDGCSADCRSNEICGNGIIDIGDPEHPKETCDDGNTISGDGCSANCFLESCGDGIYNPANGEQCDTAGDTQACNGHGRCTIPKCGDGYTNITFIPPEATAPEQCDIIDPITLENIDVSDCNGNNNGFNGLGSCRFPLCGDGYLNRKFMPPGSSLIESCDTGGDSSICNGNGNGDNRNNPNAQCQIPQCGDGYVNTKFIPSGAARPEECEMGFLCGGGKSCIKCNCN